MHSGVRAKMNTRPQMLTAHKRMRTLQPSSPLCSSIRGVWELPVPWRRPSSLPAAHLISEFPPPAERKVFHTTLISRLEGREGGGRRMRGEAGGESPRRARPQPRFPMPTSDHQSRQAAEYRERERSHHSRGETFTERKREAKPEKCQNLEAA